MSIYEYDEEKHIQQERDEAWKAGEEIGRKTGEDIGREQINLLNAKLLADQRIGDLKNAINDKEFQERLMAEYGIK